MIKLNWIALLSSVFLVTFTQADETAIEEDKNGSASSVKARALKLGKENNAGYQVPLKNSFLNAEGLNTQGGELFLTYEPDEIPVTDFDSIKKRWTMLLAESLGKQRLQELVKQSFINYDVYTDDLHFRPSFLTLELCYLLTEEQQIVDYLQDKVQSLVNQ